MCKKTIQKTHLIILVFFFVVRPAVITGQIIYADGLELGNASEAGSSFSEISGTLTTDTTLDVASSPWHVTDDFWIIGDYHLKSQAGRWDPNTSAWVIDSNTSPCIDRGDPMSPIGAELFPNGGIINMGAYGGTAEASKSYFGKPPCEIIVAGDINGDCEVNFLDFRLMTLHWLEDNNP